MLDPTERFISVYLHPLCMTRDQTLQASSESCPEHVLQVSSKSVQPKLRNRCLSKPNSAPPGGHIVYRSHDVLHDYGCSGLDSIVKVAKRCQRYFTKGGFKYDVIQRRTLLVGV